MNTNNLYSKESVAQPADEPIKFLATSTRQQGTIRAFDDQDQDYLALADTLAINRSTSRSIITRRTN